MASSSSGNSGSDCERCLCRLISRSLRPHSLSFFSPRQICDASTPSEKEAPPLTEEMERDLLISLSAVSRDMKRLTSEFDRSDPDLDGETSSRVDNTYLCHSDVPLEEGHVCLANIISLLVPFLAVKSPYIQHLAENTIVAISNFLAKTDSNWSEFLRLLWISFQASIHTQLSMSSPAKSECLTDESSVLDHLSVKRKTSETATNFASPIAALQPSLFKSSCHTAISLIQVLRNILKCIKHNHTDLTETYINLAVQSLSKLPWNLWNSVQQGRLVDVEMNYCYDCLLDREIRSPESTYVFFGALLQLFCSLLDLKDLEEVGVLDDFYTYSKFTSLVPDLLRCCLSKHKQYNHCCDSQYLRHKALMIMIRLSFWTHWKCSVILLCLELLGRYFDDILFQSISECRGRHEKFLEGSPFQAGIMDEEQAEHSCSCHLQRQAIFLFLKCCFTLVHLNNVTGQGCACATMKSSLASEVQLHRKECCSKGLAELFEWIQRHASLANSVENANHSKSSSYFALSFLQLYADEDDMFFEILLQLLDAAFVIEQEQNIGNSRLYDEINKGTAFHVSSLFNPIHLFHLFLLLLHYDHSVLLDYLISKDTGIQCVQYLLRCLHIVCRSWPVFVEFYRGEDEVGNRPAKKRNCSVGKQDSSGKKKFLYPSPQLGTASSGLLEGQKERHEVGRKCKVRQQTFEDARDCLLSLKTSIENLHRKSLFPYNPTALLRSFRRFHELCQQHQL